MGSFKKINWQIIEVKESRYFLTMVVKIKSRFIIVCQNEQVKAVWENDIYEVFSKYYLLVTKVKWYFYIYNREIWRSNFIPPVTYKLTIGTSQHSATRSQCHLTREYVVSDSFLSVLHSLASLLTLWLDRWKSLFFGKTLFGELFYYTR